MFFYGKKRAKKRRKAEQNITPPTLEDVNEVSENRKRKRDSSAAAFVTGIPEEVSARKRHRTTSDYIYSTLFVEGEGSDITICALESSWNLHKVYLCQSSYFRSMLKGDWLESLQEEIEIIVPDERIDKKALDIAFGSLYSDNIDPNILLGHIIPTTAAACMLQLEGLIHQCEEVMHSKLAPENICHYYNIAVSYSLNELQSRCLSWLETNILRYKTSEVYHINQELLEKVLVSSNLFTMQVEMDIYNFVKVWIYLQLHPERCQSNKKFSDMQKYFNGRCTEGHEKIPFLRTEDGLRFASLFRCLRLQHLLSDPKAIALVDRDCILPKEWLLPLYKEQWEKMLAVFSSTDLGPTNINQEYFDGHACRCGRVLPKKQSYCWRWTGFSYGVDLILSYDHKDHCLTMKRNTYTQPCNTAICMQRARNIAYSIKVFTLTEAGMVTNSYDTGLTEISMSFDEQKNILNINKSWVFPVYVSARFMLVSPPKDEVNDQRSVPLPSNEVVISS